MIATTNWWRATYGAPTRQLGPYAIFDRLSPLFSPPAVVSLSGAL